ncbi:TPA: response regulator [Candidatus Azambacteria bacterium]|uniref:Response regulatory domain-containing protein n=6 Tax=Candidatus Azamiibacteriota TaxID=1752741 RepID=A0A1F5C6S4_9BACT|nr:MAG: response regulator receiver protein [Candidatus Azambacteria bacterium GW2011_GWC1_46_13]KKU39130.1 MAG: Signal transduction histidine kinase [Candidatus Azambacteria bacterium GW2011_GWE2_46_45]OGD29785.1 MAG: hypothetical protein A2W60_00295 [Candidatus Azambacteria bacterium RIFCSPHIGHO2_02_46_12]OGD38525.1 MAG: hypothetical protein A3A25_00585 [Candidatus Azambacteria bacterium RIFCSPLOWO2_01_FULL_46_26]OGD44628.1 MAG: hypothetical protein A3J02_03005 [Candidatus Azambacteria bacter
MTDQQKAVLLIEDEPTLQKTISEILIQEGYKMLNALDGEIGLQMALREKPDLILLDLILPKIDGFEVLENIRKNEATKNIPVIVLTNLENAAAVERALALGALSYLVKANYELEDVVQKVKQAIK